MSKLPSRQKRLPVNPSAEHLKKQAKRLAREHPGQSLAQAQHTLAQEYACKSWAELMHVVQVMNQGANTLIAQDSDGKPRYQPLPAAVRKRDLPAVEAILASGQFTIHDLDAGLAHACWYGGSNPDILKVRKQLFDLLLAHGADPDGEYGSNYGPIVFGTGECLSHEGLQWLLDAGCDVTFQPIPTKYGSHCPLSMVLGGYERGPDNSSKHRMIRTLLAHGAVIPPDVSPPILAIHMGDHQTLADLLDKDPSLLTKRFPDMPYGNLPLKGATLLHCAVELNEVSCLDELLNRHADPNIKADVISGMGGQTPIYHAIGTIFDGSFSTLQHLVKRAGHQIDMSVTAFFHRPHCPPLPHPMTPLQYARHMSGPAAPDFLNRKKVAQERSLLESIHHGPALIAAAKSASLSALQSLTAQAVSPDYADPAGNTPLWHICASTTPSNADKLACASFLLQVGANPNGLCQDRTTPYHLAAQTGPAALVKLLQDQGALSWVQDNNKLRAIDHAQTSAHLSPTDKQAIIALIQKPRISDPLFAQAVTAIDAGDLPTLQSLLQSHPYLATAKADEPGSYAGPYFAHPALLWFIAENPIRNATLPKNICQIAHAIIDAGATLNDINYTLGLVCSGNVPRETHLAAPLIQTLVSRGADPTRALDSAVSEREIPAIKTLLQLGAKPDLPTAVALDDIELLTTLLDSKPDPANLAKAFKLAGSFGNVQALQLLLSHAVDINTVDSQNTTALHHAALHNHKPAVLFLLQNGAKRDILDNQYHGTPAGWAHYGANLPDLAKFINEWQP